MATVIKETGDTKHTPICISDGEEDNYSEALGNSRNNAAGRSAAAKKLGSVYKRHLSNKKTKAQLQLPL